MIDRIPTGGKTETHDLVVGLPDISERKTTENQLKTIENDRKSSGNQFKIAKNGRYGKKNSTTYGVNY